ncbi:hypothetical protein RJT34_20637 [Clitoria ternatea]|uniref:Uncharacterized protein n=1 Tax=Clitoria ternatea TaxID=43366 RepID=A0AAN9ITG8_CLITE
MITLSPKTFQPIKVNAPELKLASLSREPFSLIWLLPFWKSTFSNLHVPHSSSSFTWCHWVLLFPVPSPSMLLYSSHLFFSRARTFQTLPQDMHKVAPVPPKDFQQSESAAITLTCGYLLTSKVET